MAVDWIRVRSDLYRDPKVCVIADSLLAADGPLARYVSRVTQRDSNVTRNVMRNAVVGALVAVWGVIRHRGRRDEVDLHLRGVTLDVIDDVADLPGLGEAMSEVGWIELVAEGLVFPRFFEEYNTDPNEDQKKQNAERQRRFREKRNVTVTPLRNVTVTSHSNVEKSREEKSREESKENTSARANGRFVKPTIDAVAAYCLDRDNGVPAQAFMDHYESNGWKVGRNTMKDWRAAVRTWEKNHPKPKPPESRVATDEELANWTPHGGLTS